MRMAQAFGRMSFYSSLSTVQTSIRFSIIKSLLLLRLVSKVLIPFMRERLFPSPRFLNVLAFYSPDVTWDMKRNQLSLLRRWSGLLKKLQEPRAIFEPLSEHVFRSTFHTKRFITWRQGSAGVYLCWASLVLVLVFWICPYRIGKHSLSYFIRFLELIIDLLTSWNLNSKPIVTCKDTLTSHIYLFSPSLELEIIYSLFLRRSLMQQSNDWVQWCIQWGSRQIIPIYRNPAFLNSHLD